MPYPYVLEAIASLSQLNQEELHNIERPIAYLAYQNAEINRDSKKRHEPFTPEEFYYYQDQSQKNLPEPKYGAAALALIEMELFPNWALFTFKDLKARAADAVAPEFLCLQCEDAILLAPDIDNSIASGMLIACNTASEEVREMKSPCGKSLRVRMPAINNRFEASEDAELLVLNKLG